MSVPVQPEAARVVKDEPAVPPRNPLLIVGASTRAAAFSALRAGWRPICADLFADADLQARCTVRRIEPTDYPHGFLALPEWNASGPWLYTGGLENRPALIDEMTQRRQPLWGNPASVLRHVRCPSTVREILTEAGLPCPGLWDGDGPPPTDGQWLMKPLASAGGSGIRVWQGSASAPVPSRPVYWQEFISGDSCAALYVSDGQTTRLLGVTRQLVGEAWLHAAPFHYCGSVGPLSLNSAQQQAFADIGQALGRGFALRGMFGVDCVLRDGVPHPVEVNPRYTASVEVIEYATGLRALALHRLAFEAAAPVPPSPVEAALVVGKAILFARAPLRFPAHGTWRSWTSAIPSVAILPTFADVPLPGSLIEAGRPILTLFRRAETVADCVDRLRRLAATLDRWLFGH
jgi:predicted ATP-grasp superfamily ATP-dependent carboligase